MSQEFNKMLLGYGVTTADITYRMPDYKDILQSYIWQEYDLAPDFPTLHKFLDFWTLELDGPIYKVTVSHSQLIRPIDFKINKYLN